MSNKTISVYADALKRQEVEEKAIPPRESTPEVTWVRETSSDMSRDETRHDSRGISREKFRDSPQDLSRGQADKNSRDKSGSEPTRDEIQEFSFQLRDELKVKVQAEVPHTWQKELEQIALQLDVKKLELYRFIIGKFLNKV